MREAIDVVIDFFKLQVQSNSPIIGLIIGMLVIILESIIPILPLAVFIAVNMLIFGNIVGFIISWVATIIGCILAFTICKKGLSNIFYSKIKKDGKVKKIMNKISNIKFPNLVIITALPFTPAFAVNIAAGLSNISYRKFIAAILIAKVAVIYFWGFIGTTFIESITNINVLIELVLIMLGAYLISKIIMKRFDIE
ncbi:MAG: TVP38/TMEM64 family protein [Firmicutes bacterium]|nr:TVP38/TMEM64 family protein [Bacillota bacterium]